jgi:hypothetical protein
LVLVKLSYSVKIFRKILLGYIPTLFEYDYNISKFEF